MTWETGSRVGDACDRCGAGLVVGNYGGGCEDCDALLCQECELLHGAKRCQGSFPDERLVA